MSDMDDVLEANASFYHAFAERDMMAMEALWARRTPVACIHPGWNPLSDRESVMESWRAILGNQAAPRIRCANPSVFLLGGAAFVQMRHVYQERTRTIRQQDDDLRAQQAINDRLRRAETRQRPGRRLAIGGGGGGGGEWVPAPGGTPPRRDLCCGSGAVGARSPPRAGR